jgi:hypothetical protein
MYDVALIDIARQRQAEIARKTRYAHHRADLSTNRTATASNTARTPGRRRRIAALLLGGLLTLALAPHAVARNPITPAVVPVPVEHQITSDTMAAHCHWLMLASSPPTALDAASAPSRRRTRTNARTRRR